MDLTLITGNQGKADQLAMWLGQKLEHIKIDLDEIQSLELRDVVAHKAKQAYDVIKKPALVEDVSLACVALNGLPGPFIKWFIQKDIGLLCQIMDSFKDRSAVVTVLYGLHDGEQTHYFEGSVKGRVAKAPIGTNGFGWDPIFTPEGYQKTRAELEATDYEATSPRAKAIVGLKEYLQNK